MSMGTDNDFLAEKVTCVSCGSSVDVGVVVLSKCPACRACRKCRGTGEITVSWQDKYEIQSAVTSCDKCEGSGEAL